MKYFYYIILLFCANGFAQEKELPTLYTSNYKLPQNTIDSIYSAALRRKIVMQNFKNDFKYPDLLCTKDYEIELQAILKNKYVNNEIKKTLILTRLMNDYKTYGWRTEKATFKSLEIRNRSEAIRDFQKTNKTIFSWALFIINGIPYSAYDLKSYQKLIGLLYKIKSTKIEILQRQIFNCKVCLYGVIIIRDDYR